MTYLTNLTPVLIELLVTILVAAIPIATLKFYKLTGIKIEAIDRDALHSAIQSGVAAAIEGGARGVSDLVLRQAIAYAKRSVPDAIERLKADDDVLKTLAERYAAQASTQHTAP